MGFRQGTYARIWKVEDKGNYSVAQVSTRKKKEDGKYETDFQDGFVRLVGSAHDVIKSMSIPENGVSVKISSCDVTRTYNADKKENYTNFVIFGLELADGSGTEKTNSATEAKSKKATTKKSAKAETTEDEDDLPF